MPILPLYYDFSVRLVGPTFGADVRVRGRATCVEEFGATWMYGVNPGSLAAEGSDLREAYVALREAIAGTLCDLAEMSKGIEAFERAARDLLAATNRASVSEWERARQAVRSGSATDVSLRRETGNLSPLVAVKPLAASRDGEPISSGWKPSESDGPALGLLAA